MAADAAFRAPRYDDAGRLYATLEREGRLPANRRDHWAYCRWAEVVRQINARPSTPQEWAQIDAEIQRIFRARRAGDQHEPLEAYALPGGIEHSAYCGPDGALVLDVFQPVREDYRERWHANSP